MNNANKKITVQYQSMNEIQLFPFFFFVTKEMQRKKSVVNIPELFELVLRMYWGMYIPNQKFDLIRIFVLRNTITIVKKNQLY